MLMVWLLQGVQAESLLDRLRALAGSAEHGLTGLLIAVGVGLLAWAVAALLAWITRALLRALRFDAAVRGLTHTRGIGAHEPSAIASWAVYWVLLATGVVIALDVLGFNLSASLAQRLADILPRVLTASIVLVAGVLVAMGLGTVTRRFFESAGFGRGRLRGQIVTVLFSFVALLLALEQLGFAAQFVMGIGLVVAGAAGIALALAFGLGCRDLARDFIVEYLRSLEDDRASKP